jgi:hypothetical protein
LLAGRLVVRRALLHDPKIRVLLPESSDQRFDLDALEKQIAAALDLFRRDLSAPRIDLAGGSAEIRFGARPPVVLENVTAQTGGSPEDLRIALSARSNLCERFSVQARISPGNLAAQLDLGVRRLKIKESLGLLPLQISEYAEQGETSFDVKIASVGLRRVKASIDGSLGPLVFVRHGGTATIEAKRLTGALTYAGGLLQVDVQQLELGSPRLQASGELKVQSGSLSARIKVRDVDIAAVSRMALQTAGDVEGVKRIFRYLPAGRIPDMSIESHGDSVAELASTKNIVVFGSIRDCKVSIPGLALELMDVSGSVRIADRLLEAKDIAAKLGTTKGWDGRLRLGLEGKSAPFHLDMLMHTGAPELLSFLLKVVRDPTVRAEIMKVRNVEGEMSGRLILGETLDAISPVVAISKADISAAYEPIPFPIAIRGARLDYDQKIIRLENVRGSAGHSTFGGLGATLHLDGTHRIKVESRRASLDLQQTDTVLRSLGLRSHLAKVQSARGQIEFHNLSLTGAYDAPAGWTFASTGNFSQVEIAHTDFPERITLSRGKFTARQGRITFSDTTAAMSDASLIAGGTYEYGRDGSGQLETSGTATVGGQMTRWIGRHIELPEELILRSPLTIAAGRLAWRAGGDIAFRGQMTVAGGPQISLDVTKQPERLAVQKFSITDDGRRAGMTFRLAKDSLAFSFSGELTQQTIDKLFASFPMKAGSVAGDIQLSAAPANSVGFSARGQLSGSNVSIPPRTAKMLLEKFDIEGNGESVRVRSADLRWGESRLAIAGEIAGAKETLRVDLDVTGDQFDWDELQRPFGRAGAPRPQGTGGVMSLPDVEGTIRLKTESFSYEGLIASALETTAVLSRSGFKAEINRGVVCGIHTAGVIDAAGADIGLDLQLSAQEAPLEATAVCLTNRQSDIKGTYSLTARITGRADRRHLRSSLKGDFQVSGRDGEFIRSPGIDATFDYLNATGDFKVVFPDLDRETFPYRFAGVRGRIDGQKIVGDEINVASSLLNVSGQGTVDLERKQIDGKGLIAVLKPADDVITRIPVIGSVLGASIVGIPVRVSGSLERPDVTYLSPADVGAELLNMPLRILRLPFGAMRLFTPSPEDLR